MSKQRTGQTQPATEWVNAAGQRPCASTRERLDAPEFLEQSPNGMPDLTDPDPAVAIRVAMSLRLWAEDSLARSVIDARLAGWTWARVGRALGVDASAACARYGRESRAALARAAR
jgi:hypothetical protein